jgi:RHS repeat-associated protein
VSLHSRRLLVEGLCVCGGGGTESTEYFYDSELNLVKKVDALGRETLYTYDSDRNVTQATDPYGTQKWTYNSFGQPLTYKDRVDSLNSDPDVFTAVMTYSASGDLTTYTDALGNVTTLAYPAKNNKGLPDQVTDARQKVTKFKWFSTSGLLEEIEDANAKKTKFTYDARGRVKTVTNALNHVTQYNYFDDTQRKVEMIYPNADKITYRYDIRRTLESVTDERGKVTTYEFDPQYRLKKITDPLGHAKEFGYDLMSNLTSYKDALGNITDYVFDDFDRLKEIVYPPATQGATRLKERSEYDKIGRIKKHFDTADRLTEYGYDDATRTNTVTNAELETTTVKLNQRFQTVEVKDALNQVYAFSYDPLGRLLSQTRAGGTMSFEYDAVGNRKSRTDYAGRVTSYTYDNLNRLAKITSEPGTGSGTPGVESTYAYDDISRLTSAVNDMGTVSFSYDNRDRVTSTTDVFNRVVAYEYERTATVNQKRLKLDGALYATYNLDDAERLANIVNAADSATITFGYDNADRLTSRVYPNGVTTTYEYDDMSRLKRLKDVNTSGTLFDRQYQYNTANQISQITEPSLTRVFGYDNTNRLTNVSNGGSGESYAFDDVGNRTSSHLASSYGYQTGQFNRLTSAVTPSQTLSYSYDPNGNTVRKAEGTKFWQYSWDYENRLTEAATRRTKTRYKYDALGRRVWRFQTGGTENTKFTYDELDVMVDDSAGTLTKYLNGDSIDNKLRSQTGKSVSYFLADHLGSTNGLTDPTGAVTASNSYDSFGNPTNLSFPTRYQFTGREYDRFANLHYYRARFYDSNLGRFISEDPIGFAGGDVNLYGYVWNNPMRFTDPYGLDADWDQRVWQAQQDLLEALELPIAAVVGFGDGAGFGFPRMFREWQGIDNVNWDCYSSYTGGSWTGFAASLVIPAGVVGKAAQGGKLGTKLFGRHGQGILNRNDFIRIGRGFERNLSIVPPTGGREIFRIAIGSSRGRIHWHVRLWPW